MLTMLIRRLVTRETKPIMWMALRRRELLAASTSFALLLAAGVEPTAAQTRDRNAATCVNGYRTTHVVISGGREQPGVLLKCKGNPPLRRARRGLGLTAPGRGP
jgi:hypothetical protein